MGDVVDIGTEWNLKIENTQKPYGNFAVDIGTEWNLKDYKTMTAEMVATLI